MGGFTSPYGLALDLTSQVLYLTTASTTQAISLLTQLVINNQVSNAYTNGLGIIVTPLYVVASASAMSTLYYTGSTCPVPLAPSNGGVGTCLSPMYQGSTCQMTCNAGYTLVGSATSCQAGVIIAQLCSLGCTVSAPLNGRLGSCGTTLNPSTTCRFTCNTGYTLNGASTQCLSTGLIAQTCEANCAVTAPHFGSLGTCTATLASGSYCTMTCNTGYVTTTEPESYTTCINGLLTAQTCLRVPPCRQRSLSPMPVSMRLCVIPFLSTAMAHTPSPHII